MRWSKIASVICGSSEETVLGAKAEISSLLGTRKSISNPEELAFVSESIMDAIPTYVSIKAKQYKVREEEVIKQFSSKEEFICGLVFEYLGEIRDNKTFIQTFNRVCTHYYQYDGTPQGLHYSLSLLCRDLMNL